MRRRLSTKLSNIAGKQDDGFKLKDNSPFTSYIALCALTADAAAEQRSYQFVTLQQFLKQRWLKQRYYLFCAVNRNVVIRLHAVFRTLAYILELL